jgi:hypothetical protein
MATSQLFDCISNQEFSSLQTSEFPDLDIVNIFNKLTLIVAKKQQPGFFR